MASHIHYLPTFSLAVNFSGEMTRAGAEAVDMEAAEAREYHHNMYVRPEATLRPYVLLSVQIEQRGRWWARFLTKGVCFRSMNMRLERIAGVTNKASQFMQRDLHVEDRVSALVTMVGSGSGFDIQGSCQGCDGREGGRSEVNRLRGLTPSCGRCVTTRPSYTRSWTGTTSLHIQTRIGSCAASATTMATWTAEMQQSTDTECKN